jgi:HEAT repeat protein
MAISAVGLVVVFYALWTAGETAEPVYAGRTLSQWLWEYGERHVPPQGMLTQLVSYPFEELDPKAHDAVLHIGTAAVPYLLKWIAYEPSTWRHPDHADPQTIRAYGAVGAFRSLGPQAAHARDELSRILNDAKNGFSRERAAQALACLGEAGLPPLLAVLTNRQAGFACNLALESIGAMGTNARPAVPALLAHLKGTNNSIAESVSLSLSELRLEPALVVPALTDRVLEDTGRVRVLAAIALGRFGQDARPAVPALLGVLKVADPTLREFVTNALCKIDPQALKKVRAE